MNIKLGTTGASLRPARWTVASWLLCCFHASTFKQAVKHPPFSIYSNSDTHSLPPHVLTGCCFCVVADNSTLALVPDSTMRLPRAAALLLLACLLLAAAPQPAQALRLFGYNMNFGLASNSAAAAPQQAASTAGPIKPVTGGAAASPVKPVAAAAATVAVASAAKPAAAEIEVVQTHQAASMLRLMTATAGLRLDAETPQTAAAKKAAAVQPKATVSAPASHNTTAAGTAAKKPAATVQAQLNEPTEVRECDGSMGCAWRIEYWQLMRFTLCSLS